MPGVGAVQSSAPHEAFVVGGAGEGELVGAVVRVAVADEYVADLVGDGLEQEGLIFGGHHVGGVNPAGAFIPDGDAIAEGIGEPGDEVDMDVLRGAAGHGSGLGMDGRLFFRVKVA